MSKIFFQNSKQYWEKRYASGGNSGEGSQGEKAKFKVDFINAFISEKDIESIIDFGCGDGVVAGRLNPKKYIGLDISENAVKKCSTQFRKDPKKSFYVYKPKEYGGDAIKTAQLGISLEVIFHITEDDLFEKYMHDLFTSSQKYVIILSNDTDKNPVYLGGHHRYRHFTKYVAEKLPEWKLVKKTDCPGLISNFHIYAKSNTQ